MIGAGVAALLGTVAAPALAQAQDDPMATASADLAPVSLEDLFAQEVSSVAKKPQDLKEASAAVFVIGREDIRRSGAVTLPDLLRLVPGAEVAQLPNANNAVTVRGFNSLFASKLLILVDGRSIYNPAISGVTWSAQLVPVEDIERIEVVRGPGASLWGANAMNGVINVITKHAVDSLGAAATAQAVDDGDWRAYLRGGMQLGPGALRVSGQLRRERSPMDFAGRRADEYYNGSYGALRYDADLTDQDSVTLQADYAHDESGNGFGAPNSFSLLQVDMERFTTLGRWTRIGDAGARTSVQAYYDSQSGIYGPERIHTWVWDLDVSRQQPLSEHHDLVLGFGLRRTTSTARELPVPSRFQHEWYGGYVQDEATYLDGRLHLTAGVKIEHNEFTGVEVQPTLRAIWVDPAGWSLWAAASRAVRTPSDLEVSTYTPLDPAGSTFVVPGKVKTEKLDAYEIGWRGNLSPRVRLDITAFYNVYNGLIADQGALEFPAGRPTFVFRPANLADARTYGVEASLDAHVSSRWTVKSAVSALHADIDKINVPIFSYGAVTSAQSPEYQASIRSLFDVRDDLDFDLTIRRVGSLSGDAGAAYGDLDLRLAWRPTPRVEIGLLGENLLHRERVEFQGAQGAVPTPVAVVQRQVRLSISARY